jgi:hypothetical protein
MASEDEPNVNGLLECFMVIEDMRLRSQAIESMAYSCKSILKSVWKIGRLCSCFKFGRARCRKFNYVLTDRSRLQLT